MDSQKAFKKAYETLRTNCERLSENEEIDIDELVPLVEASTEAYRICKERLDSVEKALQKAFKGNENSENLLSRDQDDSSAQESIPTDKFVDDVPF